MLTSPQDVVNVAKIVPPLSEAKQIEESRKKEIQLLLENLFEREEETVKMIIDCLFDIGVTHAINKRFPSPFPNKLAKGGIRIFKSSVRSFAYRYVKKKFVLSGFLTNFLLSKVKAILK